MLHISTWIWGEKYGQFYIDRLIAGVSRNVRQPHTFHVFEPEPADKYLTDMPGCLPRLRSWSPSWQKKHGIERGERLVTLDLDLIVTGPLDDLFDRPEPFLILLGANASNKNPYNGSVQMLRAGYRPDVWSDFNVVTLQQSPKHEFYDDQGWLWYRIPNVAGWTVGAASGVYAFKKPGWPKGDALPVGARLVAFPGHRDPSQFTNIPWIAEHWR